MRRYNPTHLAILRLWAHGGMTHAEVAAIVGCSSGLVSQVVGSPLAQELLGTLQDKILDTTLDVQQTLQAAAPLVMQEKLRLALNARNESVRNSACTDIIHMAGHMPLRRMQIEQTVEQKDKFEGLSEEQIREQIYASLRPKARIESADPPESPFKTMH